MISFRGRRAVYTRLVATLVIAVMVWPALALSVEAATATWLAPPSGERVNSRNVEVSIGYNTQSDQKVTRLELWIDGRYYSTRSLVHPESRGVCSFWWDTAKFSLGPHELSVRVYAGNALVATVSSTVVIGQKNYDLRVPNVRFANIKSGDVLKGVTAIKIQVSDDSAEPPIVSLLLDGALKYITNRQPYVYALDTTKYSDGEHELQTYAYDSAGNKSDPVVVRVVFRNEIPRPSVDSIGSGAPRNGALSAANEAVEEILPPPVESNASLASVGRSMDVELRTPQAAKPTWRKELSSSPLQPGMRPVTEIPNKPDSTTSKQQLALKPGPKVERSVIDFEPVVSLGTTGRVVSVSPSLRSPLSGSEPRSEARLAYREPQSVSETSATHPTGQSKLNVPAVASPKMQSVVLDAVTKSSDNNKHPVAVRTALPVDRELKRTALARTAEFPGQAQVIAPGGKLVRAEPQLRAEDTTVGRQGHISEPVQQEQGELCVPAPKHQVSASVGTRGDQPLFCGGTTSQPRLAGVISADATTAMPRPVRLALLPTVRNQENSVSAVPSIVSPRLPSQDRNAKLEKRILHSKGAVKLRDLVNELGGVVFWDSATRTAIAYLSGIKLEVRIGSPVVMVNGKPLRTESIPRIANGRTIIDSRLYHQACMFVEQLAAADRQ